MKPTFCIMLHVKTFQGLETTGKFFIGNNKQAAYALFSMLKGNRYLDESQVLSMSLMEMEDELPLNVKIIGCTLNELSENCGIITREVFKFLNQEER